MIERINLIDKEPLKLTYTRIFQIVGGMAGVCAVLFGAQFGWARYQSEKLEMMRSEITALQEQKKTLEKAAPPKIEGGQHMEIRTALGSTPKWTVLLDDIAGKLPADMWLRNLAMGVSQSKPEEKKENKKDKKDKKDAAAAATASASPTLVLQGNARNAADIASFAQSLGESDFFDSVVLKNAEKTETDFLFVIEGQMSVAARSTQQKGK